MIQSPTSLGLPPRLELGHLPTPLWTNRALNEFLGLDLWVKRDDMSHGAAAGNKIRKLEFLLQDAIEKKGLTQLLFEPEILAKVEPSVDLAAAVLELKNLVPEKAKAAARDLVRRVVEELRKRLESRFAQAIRGSIDRSEHSPLRSLPNLDWPRTIRRNPGGYHAPLSVLAIGMGCEIGYARELVYADGVDLTSGEAVVPVGVTCRLCERSDCAQRAFPALQHPLRVNENVRGVSFFAPVEER